MKKHKTSNPEWAAADRERRRSNVAVPHRNRARYRRADQRRAAQRGWTD
jgi:hypothetical protein